MRTGCLFLFCAVLAGCGGGGGGGPSAPADADRDGVADAQDCAVSDSTRWQLRAYTSRDADSDSFSIAGSGEVCSGADLPQGYGITPPQVASAADCDDANATVWRFMTTYADADSDSVGAGVGEVLCIGAGAPTNRSLLGYDPVDDPNEPNAGTVSNLELPSWQLVTP